MSCSESHLSYEEQLNKFIGRGMFVKNKTKALERLKHISYYKIKQFSTFLWIIMEITSKILLLKQ